MEITLKNIQDYAGLSDDSDAYSATLFINGIRVGIASDDGHGGGTSYSAKTPEGWKLIREAETWCRELEPLVYESTKIPMNLCLYLANIVFEHLKQKDAQRIQKSIDRHMVDSIVYGAPGRGIKYLKGKIPIETVLKSEAGINILMKTIRESVLPDLKEGQKILNTNFTPEFIKRLGIHPNKIVEQSVVPKESNNKLDQDEESNRKISRR